MKTTIVTLLLLGAMIYAAWAHRNNKFVLELQTAQVERLEKELAVTKLALDVAKAAAAAAATPEPAVINAIDFEAHDAKLKQRLLDLKRIYDQHREPLVARRDAANAAIATADKQLVLVKNQGPKFREQQVDSRGKASGVRTSDRDRDLMLEKHNEAVTAANDVVSRVRTHALAVEQELRDLDTKYSAAVRDAHTASRRALQANQ